MAALDILDQIADPTLVHQLIVVQNSFEEFDRFAPPIRCEAISLLTQPTPTRLPLWHESATPGTC